jgi:hypothetical protein
MTTEPTKKERDPEILKQVREQVERLARLEALGQRAVACKGFQWMAGMLGLSNHSSERSIWIRVVDPPMDDTSECWPDFSDPATVGCLLALVREAWPDNGLESICTQYMAKTWLIDLPNGKVVVGNTEADALVAALEAVP